MNSDNISELILPQNADLVSIKLQLSDDVRRVKVSKNASFSEVVELIKTLFKVPVENLSLKYVDSENDECSITGELELREAFVAKKSSEILRIQISFAQQIPKKVTPPSIVLLDGGCEGCPQQQSPILPQIQRKCWPERINQKRVVIQGLNDQALLLMDEKKYEEAKLLFQKQVDILRCPWKKSVPLYNLACCEALLGNIDAALAFLTQAINSGYRDIQHIEQDPDLNSLRGLEAFDTLLSELRNKPEKKCRWKQHLAKKQETISCKNNRQQTPKPEAEGTKPVPLTPNVDIIPIQQQQVPVTPVTPVVVEPIQSLNVQEEQQEEEKKQITSEVKIESPEAVFSDSIQFQSTSPTTPTNDNELYRHELTALEQMGFTNHTDNLNMLRIAGGNLSQAVQLLLQQ